MKTLVLGASEKKERYSNKAMRMLKMHGYEVVAIGQKEGEVEGIKISNKAQLFQDVDTVTLYLGPQNQSTWYDYLIQLKPRRVIFNPGTENEALQLILKNSGIKTIEACTLVMLSIGNYNDADSV